jgi:ABC-2 type transport system ATP-binding protein
MISVRGLDKRYGSTPTDVGCGQGLPRGRVDEALASVGLTSVADDRQGTFSLGTGQRLGLAGSGWRPPCSVTLTRCCSTNRPTGWIRMASSGRGISCAGSRRRAGPCSCPLYLLAEMALVADDLVVVGLVG